MNIWLVKRKGANYFGNYDVSTEIEFGDGTTIYAMKAFYRRKDAQKYIKGLTYNDHLEVIKFTSKFNQETINGTELK